MHQQQPASSWNWVPEKQSERCKLSEDVNKYSNSVEHFLWGLILLMQSCIKYGVNFWNILLFIVWENILPKIQRQFSSRKFLLCSSVLLLKPNIFWGKMLSLISRKIFLQTSNSLLLHFPALAKFDIKIHFNTEICLENFKHLEGSAIQHDWPAKLIRNHKNLKHTPHICHNNYNCSLCKKFSQV